MFTIAYGSTAIVEFSDSELAALLTVASENNSRLDITGALLYRNGRFIQILEGPEKAVRETYSRIEADHRHGNIRLLASAPIAVRNFASWAMGYEGLPDSAAPLAPDTDHRPDVNLSGLAQFSNSGHAKTLFDWLYAYLKTARNPAPSAITSTFCSPDPDTPSDVVSAIFDQIIAEIHHGVLLPGDRISDAELSKRLGISRTPVREALQKLRTAGVVEVSPNRFTRVAIIDATRTAELMTVFGSLLSVILDEVIGRIDDRVIEAMRAKLTAYDEAVAAGIDVHMTRLGSDFCLLLVAESRNDALKQALYSTVTTLRLGSAHAEDILGRSAITDCLGALLSAAIAGDLADAKRVLTLLLDQVQASLRASCPEQINH